MPAMARMLAAVLLLVLLAVVPSASQVAEDRLALADTLPGHSPADSRRALARHFAGVWEVVHTRANRPPLTGRAEVAANGSAISLYLDGFDGRVHYRLIEADAMLFSGGRGGLLGGLVARFQRTPSPVHDERGNPIATAEILSMNPEDTLLSFEKDGRHLDLFVEWPARPPERLQVHLGRERGGFFLDGVWHEERAGGLQDGGLASWSRAEPTIDGVLVVENQLDPEELTGYPYRLDGGPAPNTKPERTLVIYGSGLPTSADRAALGAVAEELSYRPALVSGIGRDNVIAGAFAAAGLPTPEPLEAIVVIAELGPGITPSSRVVLVNDIPGYWPLIFADQYAAFRFVRTPSLATETFFLGDQGYIELAFTTPIPAEAIAVRLFKRDNGATAELGVLRATLADDDDPVFRIYRSDLIQFNAADDARRAPPPDPNALPVSVRDGTTLEARLFDPAQALAVPKIARATIRANPGELGPLWKETLDRVAVCYDDRIEDHETYQHEKKDSIEELILTELGDREINFTAGDHAAALLIRDEFVKVTSAMLPDFRRQAEDLDLLRAARAEARRNPGIAASAFWRESEVEYVTETGFLYDSTVNYTLADTLDLAGIAADHGVDPNSLVPWAETVTRKAAIEQIETMEKTLEWARGLDDCDIADLMLIARHRSPGLIRQILPRLVKLVNEPGPPVRQYWTADQVAQGYVKSLHVKGASIIALEEYGDADTQVIVAGLAVLTIGTGWVLELANAGAALFWLAVAETTIDAAVALMGAIDYKRGEDYYELAQGAVPAMGEDFLANAEARRTSLTAVALGLLPAALNAHGTIQRLRYFRNIAQGRALVRATDAALDLSRLSETERLHLAAYFDDMARTVERSGVDALPLGDRAAYDALNRHLAAEAGLPPTIPSATAGAADELADTVAIQPGSVAPGDTVVVRPAADAGTASLPGSAASEAADTIVVQPGGLDPGDTIVVRPGAAAPSDTVVVRPGAPAPDDTVVATPGAGQSPTAPAPAPPRPAAPRPPESANAAETVAITPGSTDLTEAGTIAAPADFPPPVDPYPEVTPNPNHAIDLFELEPGARLTARGIDEAEIQRIIDKSASGAPLTVDELLDKIDYMRVRRAEEIAQNE